MLLCALLAVVFLAACGGAVPVAQPLPATPAPETTSAGAVTSAPPTTAAGCGDWSCAQQHRFDDASAYVAKTVGPHGYLGVEMLDRTTGAVWHDGATTRAGWTASTIKLAIAADLLTRARSGAVTLTAADRHDMDTMLNFSDEAASDRLWKRFGDDAMLARFRSTFGMRGLAFVPGFTASTYWGFVKCTTDDLLALGRWVLTRSNADDRAYLVAALCGVAGNQQWGVWAAGADQHPGNKDGWSFESDSWGTHWVADTVGFAGPGERYVVAVTYQVDPAGSLADGVHAVSDVVAILFGRPVPAPVTVPAPDG